MHLQAVHNLGISPTSSKQPTEKQCPICEYKSSQKAVLDNHIRIVHLELQQIEENNDHQCLEKSNFGTPDSLKLTDHRKIRNVPYAIVYACVECDYGTLDAEILRKHMKAVHYH